MLRLAARFVRRRPGRAIHAILSDPRESWHRLRDELAYSAELRQPPATYDTVADWEARLHASLGRPWPCEATTECTQVWPRVLATLSAHGIEAGPETYLHWNDGDPAFIRALWCLVRHLRPAHVVETGVGHGVSSRFMLEALRLNGGGRLYSIDLPPLQSEWQMHVGIAVGEGLADSWRLIAGSSRTRLRPLLAELSRIDMFVHDSLHSARNLRFELEQVWPRLAEGGALVVDDIDASHAFRDFVQARPDATALACEAEPFRPDVRRYNRKGAFGIILKRVATRPAA